MTYTLIGNPDLVPVEYIESGAFQGGEEQVSNANIEYGEVCFVVRKEVLEQLLDSAWKYNQLSK